MKRAFRKSLLVTFMVMLAVICFTFGASALEAKGKCGENVTWNYTPETGEVVISGSGDMYDYSYSSTPFYQSGVKSVVIEEGVTNVSKYAFYYCETLESIEIPDGVTSIGERAFYNCKALTEIEIPDGVTSLGDSSFYECAKLAAVEIPDSVTSIAGYAFYGCKNLADIKLGGNITSIGRNIFNNTSYINNSENWEDGCLYIGNYLFGVRSDLSDKLIIKDGTTLVMEGAFDNAKNITGLTIPECLVNMNTAVNPFWYCSSLVAISVDENNESFSTDENGVLFNKDKTVLIAYPAANPNTAYQIPDSVTSISSKAFYQCNNLTSVTIPESVTTVGDSAFAYSKALETVEMACKAESISSSMFSGCSALKSVTIPEGVKIIDRSAFSGCSALTGITLSQSLTKIGDSAFSGCSLLTEIEIPDNVTYIGSDCFKSCDSLADITLSDNCFGISSSAFTGTKYYADASNWSSDYLYIGKHLIKVRSTITGTYSIKEGTVSVVANAFMSLTGMTGITIPDSVSYIGNNAFYQCTALTEVIVPDSVTYIGSQAFYGCTALTSAVISDNVKDIHYGTFGRCENMVSIDLPDNLETIGNNAFQYCKKLTTIDLSDTITSIGSSAFDWCRVLASVNIPDGLTSISADSFRYTALTSVSLHEGITSIGSNAFEGSYLTSVTIPSTVKSIGTDAFYYCTSLTRVTLSEGLESIGADAFENCSRFTSINIPASVKEIKDGAFKGCSSLSTVSVNSSNEFYCTDSYGVLYNKSKTHLVYYPSSKTYTSYTIPSTVETIGNYAFYSALKITSITVPESVVTIGASAFETNNIKTVNISNIDAWLDITFKNANSNPTNTNGVLTLNGSTVTSVEIPSDKKAIKAYTFYNCTGITEVKFHDNVETIGAGAFYGCTGITELNLPESIATIGSEAFAKCTGITKVRFVGLPSVESNSFTSVKAIGYYPYEASEWKRRIASSYCGGGYFTWQARGANSIAVEGTTDSGFEWSVDIDGNLFLGGTGSMGDYSISSSVTTAPWKANMKAIKKIIVNDGVSYIGKYAFYGGSNVSEIIFLGNCPEFCENYALTGLKATATYKADNSTWYLSEIETAGGSITWKPIGLYEDCIDFYNSNYGLSWKLTYDGTLSIHNSDYTTINYSAGGAPWYKYRRLIKKAEFSSTSSSIGVGKNYFYDCDALESFASPKEYTIGMTVGENAFYRCSSLKTIDVPRGILGVGKNAFAYCTSLESFFLAHYTTYENKIGEYAFNGCTSLKKVSLPAVVSVGAYAFNDCTALKTIDINSSDSISSFFNAQSNSFNGVTATVLYPYQGSYFYVPASDKYGGTLTWTEASEGNCAQGISWKLNTETGVMTFSGSGAFCSSYRAGSFMPWYKYRDKITSVVVGTGITYIPSYVFEYLECATTITLPETLKKIYLNAFNDCESLNNLILPSSIETFGDSSYGAAFIRCNSLTDVYYKGTKEDFANVTYSSNIMSYDSTMTMHFLVENSLEPTCTEKGIEPYYVYDKTDVYSTMYDANRNVITSVKSIPALGHSFTNYVSDSNATYYEDGTKTAKCDRCEETDTVSDEGSKLAPVSISIVTLPQKLSYGKDETVDLDGLTFLAEYADGGSATFSGADVTQITASTAQTGRQTATISYMNCTADFIVFVHEKLSVTVDKSLYPESAHNYSNNINESKTFTYEGAEKLTITFSTSTATESNYDYIYLYNASGSLVGKYTGTQLSGKTFTINGNKFTIKLTSDGSSVKYGYSFSSIVAHTSEIYHPEVIDPETATCTEPGLSQGSHCEICDMVLIKQEDMAAKGHSFTQYQDDNNVECEKNGTKTAKCDRCDATETVEIENSATGHAYVDHEAKSPTCTEKGHKAYQTCENCDYTTYEEVAENGHAYVDHEAKAPTCTEKGHKAYQTCENCDYTTYEEVAENGHAYVNHEAKSPTCTEKGHEAYQTCENCNYTTYEEVAENGHAYVNHEAKAPTCTEKGHKEYQTCKNCDYTTYEEVAENGHAYVNHEAKAPTCTEKGHKAYQTCENCDYTTYEEVAENGHAYVDHEAKAPTCTENGHKAYQTCENCNYTTYEEVAENGHAYVNHEAKAPTCTEKGHKAYQTCKNCDYTTYEEVAKTGHSYISKITNAATCTATGTKKYTCSACGDSYSESIAKLAHTYRTSITKATLTKNGKTEIKCSVCGYVNSTTTIYYPKTIKLSATNYTYTGKVITPSVTVKASNGNTLKKDTDYTVTYSSGRKNTGKYTVTITFKGKYSGKKTLYFNILPGKTSKITPKNTTNSIKATWKKVTGATGYKVELLNSKGKVLKTVTTTKLTYTFKKLSKVTTYKVRVTAYKTIDSKKVYSSVSTTLTTSTAPAAVTLSKVTAGSKQATPAWKTVSGASGYEVQYSTSSKFKSAKTATVKKGSSKKTTIKKLTKGKTYYFKVRAYKAVDGKKVYGAWSSVKSVKVK